MIIFSRLKNFIIKISSAVLNELGGKKKIFAMVSCLILIGVFFVFPHLVSAEEATVLEQTAAGFFIWIFRLFLYVGGQLLLFMTKTLIAFCSYNDFANSTAVVSGWVIVRDLVNMFFVVVLLVIAIATILKIESYSYKKMLGRLVLMAVLVNFSKTISLLFIDFAQVIMMTFVNGFQAAGGGNFVTALGLTEILAVRDSATAEELRDFNVAAAYLLGLIMILISTVVVGMMLIILVMRTIVLWILIVLSPLAFFLSIIPQAKKYADQWWGQFTEYVLVGPILAFFLWLSLVPVTTLSDADKPSFAGDNADTQQNVGISAIGGQDNLISFVIAIGMLVGGLTMTGKMGVIGAGIGIGVLTGAKKMGIGAAKWTAKKPWQGYAYGARKLKATTGWEINPANIYKNLKTGFEEKKAKDERLGVVRAGELMARGGLVGAVGGLGAPGWVDQYAQGWFYNKGIKSIRATPGRIEKLDSEAEEDKKRYEVAKEQKEQRYQNNLSRETNDVRDEAEIRWDSGELLKAPDGEEYSYRDLMEMKRQAGIVAGSEEEKDWDNKFFKGIAQQRLGEFKEDSELKGLREEAEKSYKKAETVKAFKPEDHMARAMRREEWEKKAKRFVTTNDEECVRIFTRALAKGDVQEAAGALLHTFKVGHGNEVIEETKADKNWYWDKDLGYNDQRGDLLFKKGENFSASQQGFSCFMNQEMVGKMKLARQTAYSLQNDLSNIAETTNHWFAGQSIGQDSDGTYYQNSVEVKQLRCGVEKSKKDFENFWRQGNRLAHCTEEKGPDGKKRAILDPETLVAIKRDWEKFHERMIKGGRLNPNFAMHMAMPHNIELLEKVAITMGGDEGKFRKIIEGVKEYAGKAVAESTKDLTTVLKEEIEKARKNYPPKT